MDPTVLNNLITSIKEVLLRSNGSKRLVSFYAWLIFLAWEKPTDEVLIATAVMTLTLWVLFIKFPGKEELPTEVQP